MTLLNKKYTYKTIDRKSVGGKRLYVCPDGSSVPSVTTILSATQPIEKKESLSRWRASIGEAAAQKITTEAAGRGTRMHKYLEDFIMDGVLSAPGTNIYSIQSHKMAQTIIDQGFTNVNEVWGSEIGLYYPQLYAGTADAIGVHHNDECVFDYKQANKEKKEQYIEDYYLQLTAYALSHNAVYGTNIKKGVILMCVKPPEVSPGRWGDTKYQEFILTPDKFDFWANKWWDKVEQFYRENR